MTERRHFARRERRSVTRWNIAFENAAEAVSRLDGLMEDYADALGAGAFNGPDYTDAEREAVKRVVCCFAEDMDFGVSIFFQYGWNDENLPELPEEYDPEDGDPLQVANAFLNDLREEEAKSDVSANVVRIPRPRTIRLSFGTFDGGPDHAS